MKGIKQDKLTIVKVGGAIVEDEEQLAPFLQNVSSIRGRKVLVHGGGRQATKIASLLGIETKMIDGRRITDASMLEIVTMVYGGLVNKNIVSKLQAIGVNAIGLTGADGNIITAHRRPVIDGIDFGFVGDVNNVNHLVLKKFIENGTPIIAPLTHDGNGNLLNTNADTIASAIARSLSLYYDVTLIYCFEKKGVLYNPQDDESVIPTITHADFIKYKADGIIAGGMLPKLENAFSAIDAGVSRVIITQATDIDGKQGTIIS
ncbi:MAG: acetylglutamate kinase [Prevotella sp.]|nr:acetylglutamate kinase [Prevotella sp.]